MASLDSSLQMRLRRFDDEGVRRRANAMPGVGGKIPLADGSMLLNFSCNDYLDLARNPQVVGRAAQALERWGCGSTASRLMTGTLALHEELEAELTLLLGGGPNATALVFSSGFAMNSGVLSSIAGRDDVIFADRLIHASLIDGARLGGGSLKRFAHTDVDMLAQLLRDTPCHGHRFIVCESVYSMDGDLAPLVELRRLANDYDATLLTDEAHAIGVFGRGGGLGRMFGETAAADLTCGTLGKALGSLGGFVICRPLLRDYLVNQTRSFIYATALPPACVAAALGAIDLIRTDPGIGERLLSNARGFHAALQKQGLRLEEFGSQIVPIHVGDNRRAVELAERLRTRGLITTAIRPPTVPQGTSRLRLSVTLAHTPEDLAWAAEEIGTVARAMGITEGTGAI